MKKVFLCMIVILMPLMMTQTGFAASEFSLINGDLAEKSTEYALLQEFFQSIQISSSFDAARRWNQARRSAPSAEVKFEISRC